MYRAHIYFIIMLPLVTLLIYWLLNYFEDHTKGGDGDNDTK